MVFYGRIDRGVFRCYILFRQCLPERAGKELKKYDCS